MKVLTYSATIYVGRKCRKTGLTCKWSIITKAVELYVNKIGLCVTVTPTYFFYTNGKEKGAMIGFINYPRFPSTNSKIKKQALELANILRIKCKQLKVSVVFPKETIMLG